MSGTAISAIWAGPFDIQVLLNEKLEVIRHVCPGAFEHAGTGGAWIRFIVSGPINAFKTALWPAEKSLLGMNSPWYRTMTRLQCIALKSAQFLPFR